jgi:HAD superfamily hydrolase (TIGR01549 family)
VRGYDAILFDSDGVLVEPPAPETQREATRAAFEAQGIEEVDRRFVTSIVEGVTVEELDEICAAGGLEAEAFWDAREYHDERTQLEDFRMGRRKLYEDVAAIEELSGARGVVSNNHHSTIAFVLDFFDLGSLFETYYGREKTIESLRVKKPNPHYLERALADLDSESALYVGDSESDVIAAHDAGIDSAFIRRPHCRTVDLSTDPTYEVQSLHELPELATTPGS